MEKLLDENFPRGLGYEYEASLASHDPLDDDDVPECPPAAVEIEDDDDPISGVTSGFDVTASIACDAASVASFDRPFCRRLLISLPADYHHQSLGMYLLTFGTSFSKNFSFGTDFGFIPCTIGEKIPVSRS